METVETASQIICWTFLSILSWSEGLEHLHGKTGYVASLLKQTGANFQDNLFCSLHLAHWTLRLANQHLSHLDDQTSRS